MQAIVECDGWQKVVEISDYNMRTRRIDLEFLPLTRRFTNEGIKPNKQVVPLYRFYWSGASLRGLPLFLME